MSSEEISVTGAQHPRILVLPKGMSRASDESVALAKAANLHLDPWQEMLLRNSLAESDKMYFNDVLNCWMPKYAAYECGVVVARQNGKGNFLEARTLAGLFLMGERLIAWTAHEVATAKEGFQRFEAIIDANPELKREVKHVRLVNGEQGIELKPRYVGGPSQRVIFRTRTKKALRGFTVDTLLFDEAMILDPDMFAAMAPTLSARPNGQMIYTGSAGDENSIQFGRLRHKAMHDLDPRAMFAEWSADVCTDFCAEDCNEHDAIDLPQTYAKANPAYGVRIDREACDSERTSMDREKFCRERLSVGTWPVEGDAWAVIPKDAWSARHVAVSAPQRPFTFGVDISPDRKYGCITVAGFNGEKEFDGTPQVHVEVTAESPTTMDYRLGVDWIVPRLKQLHKNHKNSTFVLDKGAQAGSLLDELETAGLKVLTPTAREYAQWCGVLYSAVVPIKGNRPYLVHSSQAMLNSAVAAADKRDLADLWAWDKRNAISDISPIVSGTLALYGHDKVNTKKTPSPGFAFV